MTEWECARSMLGRHLLVNRLGGVYCKACGEQLEAEGEAEETRTMRTFKANEREREAREGAKRRDRALDDVTRRASSAWRALALRALHEAACKQPTLTADDVMIKLRENPEIKTHETRAMGGVMQTGKAQGWIQPTDTFKPSARAEAHRGPKRVWRSLITDQDSML